MSAEELFVSTAVLSTAMMGVFVYLHWQAKDEFWKGVWMFLTFGVMNWALNVNAYGLNIDVSALGPVAYLFYTITTWVLMGMFGYLGFVLLVQLITYLMNGRKRQYGKTDEKAPEYGGVANSKT